MRLVLLFTAALALAGCCSSGSVRCYLARAQTALEAGDKIAMTAIAAACKPKVEAECKGKGLECDAYKKCEAAIVGYKAARRTAGAGLVEANRALSDAGVK